MCFDEAERGSQLGCSAKLTRVEMGGTQGRLDHPTQMPMLTNIINTLAAATFLMETILSRFKSPPGLRLICELSAGGIPEDNDPSLCICLFNTLLQVCHFEMLANS